MPFKKLDAEETSQRLLVSVWGQEKTGKTSFALTFPPPIYFFDFDLGAEAVYQSSRIKKSIMLGITRSYCQMTSTPIKLFSTALNLIWQRR